MALPNDFRAWYKLYNRARVSDAGAVAARKLISVTGVGTYASSAGEMHRGWCMRMFHFQHVTSIDAETSGWERLSRHLSLST